MCDVLLYNSLEGLSQFHCGVVVCLTKLQNVYLVNYIASMWSSLNFRPFLINALMFANIMLLHFIRVNICNYIVCACVNISNY